MTKNTSAAVSTVDYATARANLIREAKAFHGFSDRAAGALDKRTAVMAQTIRDAEDTGAIRDGRDKSTSGTDALTKSEVAAKAGVTGTIVTYWSNLAAALRVGVTPGDAVWGALAGTGQAARRADVGKACKAAKSTEDIVRAMADAGLDPVTGKRLAGNGKGTPKGKGKDQGTEPEETPVSPYDAARDALKVLGAALKSPTVGPEEYDVLRKSLVRLLTTEDKRRGWTPPVKAVKAATPEAKSA